ncbi:YolD-like family protein [Virgibacillus pantothenticus]|nr:YolD-like family protein [Virgibacillus pantothenticus]
MNLKLLIAVTNDLTVELEYYDKHDFYKAKGKITSINRQNKYISISGQHFPFESIIDVWVIKKAPSFVGWGTECQ